MQLREVAERLSPLPEIGVEHATSGTSRDEGFRACIQIFIQDTSVSNRFQLEGGGTRLSVLHPQKTHHLLLQNCSSSSSAVIGLAELFKRSISISVSSGEKRKTSQRPTQHSIYEQMNNTLKPRFTTFLLSFIHSFIH